MDVLKRMPDFWVRASSLPAFFLLWEIAAALLQSPVFPGPVTVAFSMWDHLTDGHLVSSVLITLRRVIFSFVIAMLIGVAIGILMGSQRRTGLFLEDWLVLGLNIPALVVIILSYIWLGLTETAAILAVVVNKVPLVAVIVKEGAKAVDRDLMQVAQIYRLPWQERLSRVYLPQLYPYIMSAARSGLSLIWKIVLVVELLGRSDGVGFDLHGFFQFFDIASIFAYTFAFIGVILFFEILILRPMERRLTAWRLA